MKTNTLVLIFAIILLSTLCLSYSKTALRQEQSIDLTEYFKKYQVKGTFLLFDKNQNKFYVHNRIRARKRFCPASSFKIFGTLAILDLNILVDENEILEWDGEKYFMKSWNQNQSLKEAFHNSTEWVYQRLISQIGRKKMQAYLTKSHYGNEKIGSEIDRFWLDKSFKVSTFEQIAFLRKLEKNQLPFDQISIDKTKEIMIQERSSDYVLRGKTGTSDDGIEQMSWFIGYLEQNSNTYFFATNVYSPSEKEFFESKAVQARIPLTKEILENEFNLLKSLVN